MTPEQLVFMSDLDYFGGSARVRELGPQVSQTENSARQFCRRRGWAIFDRRAGCWRITREGREALRAMAALPAGQSKDAG